MSEFDKNQQVADEICRTRTWQGRQFVEGDFVGLLDGKVYCVDKTALKVLTTLREHDPNPQRGMMFQVAYPQVDVIR